MGVLKVHHIDQSVAESRGLLSHVSGLLSQSQDPGVVGNCLSVISAVEGYSSLTTKVMVYKLLTMIKASSKNSIILNFFNRIFLSGINVKFLRL